MSGYATFWHGPLPPLIRACLASFPARGAQLTLFAYDAAPDAPRGVALRDAREICPDPARVGRYFVGGRPSLAHFADRFRYELVAGTDFCWVDADMVALRPAAPVAPVIWGRQPEAKGKALVNNAVLKLPARDPVLQDMLAAARAAEGRDIDWGALGPYLLTEVAEAHGAYETTAKPERYYAVAPDEFWRLIDPTSRAIVAKEVAASEMVHLWSELLRRTGYDFNAAPPPGAYLHETFAQIDALRLFPKVATAADIEALIARWNASAPTADTP